MKKIELKTRNLLRNFFAGISLTAAAFIFQACYGMVEDTEYDLNLSGTVKSKITNMPIKGIKVTVNDGINYGITDNDGKFDFYASVPSWGEYEKDGVRYTPDSVMVHFLDIDGIENGLFADTTIIINPAHRHGVVINMEMIEIE